MELLLPEADIDGLHFNQQKVHAVFELKDDGKYYSRDILFHSARDTDEGTSEDILLKYLNHVPPCANDGIRAQLAEKLGVSSLSIEVSLPEENQGIKKYNGVSWWYWVFRPTASSAANFANVSYGGLAGHDYASAVGGCAPAFRVIERTGDA